MTRNKAARRRRLWWFNNRRRLPQRGLLQGKAGGKGMGVSTAPDANQPHFN